MNYIKYKSRLRKLYKWRDRVEQDFETKKSEKKDFTSDEREKLEHDHRFELDMVEDEIYKLETNYLLEVARKMLLPIPEFDKEGDLWEKSRLYGYYYLTRKGISELRSTIRNEKIERKENYTFWLAGITGLVDVNTGLIAVFKS